MSNLGYILKSIWYEKSNRGQRLRRVGLFLGWQIWKRTAGTPRQTRLFNGLRIIVRPDCDVSPAALYYALPNGGHIAFLREHLSGGTFVDVGANVGLISLLVADKIDHAILFEPHPETARRATENMALNGLKFQVVREALSDTVGTVAFESLEKEASCNRTVEGFSTSLPTITVPRTTFDHFLRDHPGVSSSISAVKIDVEGHENAVLRGMTRFLREQRPRLVMFEYLERTDIRVAMATFEGVGYSVFELSDNGPRLATNEVKPLQDLFACPTELAREFGLPVAADLKVSA